MECDTGWMEPPEKGTIFISRSQFLATIPHLNEKTSNEKVEAMLEQSRASLLNTVTDEPVSTDHWQAAARLARSPRRHDSRASYNPPAV